MVDSPLLSRLAGYIDGAWGEPADRSGLEVRNPANGELLARVPRMGRGETVRAVEAAAREFEAPREGLAIRAEWLRSIAGRLRAERDELGRIVTLENGKPWAEGKAEAEYAAGFFAYLAEHLEVLAPRTLAEQPRDHLWTVHHRPAGVAALITPWNFPLAMVAKKLSAALGAGCSLVVKPSAKTPLSMIALFTLLEELGLPAGRVNLVIGDAGPIGSVLCEHPAVRIVSFTGSTEVGQRILAATAPHVKRVALELGGNAPFLVFADANLDGAVEHLVQNKLRASGQTCVCTNRILVAREVVEDFAARLVARLGRLRVGPGLDEGVEVGPLVDAAAWEKVAAHLADAVARGGVRRTAADPAGLRVGKEPWGCFFPPTVVTGVDENALCAREETFGPLFPLFPFEGEEEAVRLANGTIHGLAAYLFTADEDRAARVVARLRFGHVGVNTGTGPVPEAPFGGMKQSGIGREGGIEGLLEYVELQTVPRPRP